MFVDIYNTAHKYQIIYADPPWRYDDDGYVYGSYSSMSLKSITELPIKRITSANCVLFLWVTYPMLKEGLEVIEAWGFQYKTIAFQWVKLNRNNMGAFLGLGNWTRGNTEACLLGIKGKPSKISGGVFQLIMSPIQEHSKKPAEVRDRIVQLMGNLLRIELFARQHSEGWHCWGNEVEETK